MSEEPLLAVERLSIDFETEERVAHILREVSLEVPARRHVALVGESGCGKSVTMRAIMGLLTTPPAKFRGGQIRKCTKQQRRKSMGGMDSSCPTFLSHPTQIPFQNSRPQH